MTNQRKAEKMKWVGLKLHKLTLICLFIVCCFFVCCLSTNDLTLDEQTILEQMIKDTEDPIQDEEEGVASYEHLLEGSEDKSSVLEPGSPAALFEQFTIR